MESAPLLRIPLKSLKSRRSFHVEIRLNPPSEFMDIVEVDDPSFGSGGVLRLTEVDAETVCRSGKRLP